MTLFKFKSEPWDGHDRAQSVAGLNLVRARRTTRYVLGYSADRDIHRSFKQGFQAELLQKLSRLLANFFSLRLCGYSIFFDLVFFIIKLN